MNLEIRACQSHGKIMEKIILESIEKHLKNNAVIRPSMASCEESPAC